MGQDEVAQGKKNASRLAASLIFLDESGFLLAPLVRRTWAPQGQTPILRQRTNTYRKLSAIAALVVSPRRDRVRLFFSFYPNANINAARVQLFLRHLHRHIRGPGILLWDRFPAHRGRSVQSYLAEKTAWRSEFLPAYAPELNPMENVWCYMKTHSRTNEVVFDLVDLTESARRHGRALQRRDGLLRSFLKHTPLFLRLK
ncbi:MAG: transposase [Candidatus Aminicenantes bacterium]|nr:transposase [Candidatus Aminicenantes bacterium]